MVRLVPMTEDEFQAYLKRTVAEYAQEHVRAGNWHPSEALQKAEQTFIRLLPDGIASKNNYLYSIEDSQTGMKVGIVWFAVNDGAVQPSAFLYDFWITEECRRQGYGRQTLQVLEEKARQMGLEKIGLHAFAHNQAAVALYQKAGYQITDLGMAKKLSA